MDHNGGIISVRICGCECEWVMKSWSKRSTPFIFVWIVSSYTWDNYWLPPKDKLIAYHEAEILQFQNSPGEQSLLSCNNTKTTYTTICFNFSFTFVLRSITKAELFHSIICCYNVSCSLSKDKYHCFSIGANIVMTNGKLFPWYLQSNLLPL